MPKNNSIEYVEVSMCGNLGSDPVIKEVTVNGEPRKVANFSVAVNNRRADASAPSGYSIASTTWVSVSAWGVLADLVSSLKSGQVVEVVGDITSVSTYMSKGPEPKSMPSISLQASRVSSSVWNNFQKQAPVAELVVEPMPSAPSF
jgi:single-stranded DNA-binding protein